MCLYERLDGTCIYLSFWFINSWGNIFSLICCEIYNAKEHQVHILCHILILCLVIFIFIIQPLRKNRDYPQRKENCCLYHSIKPARPDCRRQPIHRNYSRAFCKKHVWLIVEVKPSVQIGYKITVLIKWNRVFANSMTGITKIRRSLDSLIFIMEILWIKRGFYI